LTEPITSTPCCATGKLKKTPVGKRLLWSLDDLRWYWAAGEASYVTLSFSQKAIEKRALLDPANNPPDRDARQRACHDQRVVPLTVGPSSLKSLVAGSPLTAE
jgi:hypothetical protein